MEIHFYNAGYYTNLLKLLMQITGWGEAGLPSQAVLTFSFPSVTQSSTLQLAEGIKCM